MVVKTDRSVSLGRRVARVIVALPLLGTGSLLLYVVIARQTARVVLPFSASIRSAATWVSVTLVLVLPLLWVGIRTLDKGIDAVGHVVTYLYAAVLGGTVVWTAILSRGSGGAAVESIPALATVTVIGAGLLVGVGWSIWLARADPIGETRKLATRSVDTTAVPGRRRSDVSVDEWAPRHMRRRSLFRVAGVAGVSLLGGVVVGRDLSVASYHGLTPQSEFDFAYDGDTVAVTHAGGDDITAENTGRLQVVVGEEATTWPLPVSAAEEVTVDVAPGDTVEVVWYAPTNEQTQVFADFVVPE